MQLFPLGARGSHANQRYLVGGCPKGHLGQLGSQTRGCKERTVVLTCSDRCDCKRKVWANLEAIVMEDQVFVHCDGEFDTAGSLATAIVGDICHRHSATVRQEAVIN